MTEENNINETTNNAVPKQMEKGRFIGSKPFWFLVIILILAFLLRLFLANIIHGHPTDINNFKAWAIHVAKHGFPNFYKDVNTDSGVWCDYPPLYIMVLWFFSKLYQVFDPNFAFWSGPVFTIVVKFPPILADLGSIALLVVILKRYVHVHLALLAGFLFAIHPAVFYESAMWGQIDSITFALQLLSILFLIQNRLALALVVTAFNILVKPQGLILLPFILFLGVFRKQWKELAWGTVASFASAFLLSLPFVSVTRAIPWLWDKYAGQANLYPYSSIQAFNLWSFTGMWKSDMERGILPGQQELAPIIWQHKTWGLILFAIAYALCLWFYYRYHKKEKEGEEGVTIWHTSTLIMLAFFLFPTRMHERYLYSGLFLLLGSQTLNRKLSWPFVALSFTFFLNLLYELPGKDKKDLNFPSFVYSWNELLSKGWFQILALINLLVFAYICFILLKDPLINASNSLLNWLKNLSGSWHSLTHEKEQEERTWIPVPQPIDRVDIYWILGLMVFSALPKLWRLGIPAEMVFDEVYHARAGGEYVLGIHPFEWVHPPLAKLLIAVGVYVYDLTGVGWRIMPVIAGVLLIPVLYLLGRFLLPHRWQAIAAAFLLTCDGVYFVQSRTAMTNIFATLFQVSSLTFLWRYLQYERHRPGCKRNYWFLLGTSICIGLALSSRWTSLWSYGFIICVLFAMKVFPGVDLRQFVTKGRLTFLPRPINIPYFLLLPVFLFLIPALIYLLSYSQYMSLGNTLMDTINMQKGIWQYHSGLDEPHPYYSAWYTWPFLIRPTWYHFLNNGNGTVSGIIALGNPAIWWLSIPVAFLLLILALFQKKLNLWYIGVAFLFMYFPWSISPRTLNFSHYFFEAVPYACLAITYMLGEMIHILGHGDQVMKKIGIGLTASYICLVFAIFAFFFPLYSAHPITWDYYRIHIWFKSWV